MEEKNSWLKKKISYTWNEKVNSDKIIQKLKIQKKDKVLDIGCGKGAHLQDIWEKTSADCYGVDIRDDLLKFNKKKKIKLKHSDMRNLQFPDNYFDKIFALGVFEHVPETEMVISEASRVLKTKGRLFFSVPNKVSFFHITKVIKQILGRWDIGYEKGFTILKLREILGEHRLRVISAKVVPHQKVSNFLNFFDNFLNKISSRSFGFFIEILASKT